MNKWTIISDSEHGYSFSAPERTPGERPAAILKNKEDGYHQVHVHSADESELYFEVISYSEILDHPKASNRQKDDLLGRSRDGTVSEEFGTMVGKVEATGFNFQGTLNERWKVRRFLYFDGQDRTYRIIYDPTSPLNEQVLKTFYLETQEKTERE